MSHAFTLVVREVYEDGGGKRMFVRPDSDRLGSVRVEHDNGTSFSVPKDMARQLAEAINACADEITT